jgi:hypothetical protein
MHPLIALARGTPTLGDCSSILRCAVSVAREPGNGAFDSKMFVIAAAAIVRCDKVTSSAAHFDKSRKH